jgi:hypothetical protein
MTRGYQALGASRPRLGRHLYCGVEIDFAGAATRSHGAMAWSRNRKSVFPKPTYVELNRSLNPAQCTVDRLARRDTPW